MLIMTAYTGANTSPHRQSFVKFADKLNKEGEINIGDV